MRTVSTSDGDVCTQPRGTRHHNSGHAPRERGSDRDGQQYCTADWTRRKMSVRRTTAVAVRCRDRSSDNIHVAVYRRSAASLAACAHKTDSRRRSDQFPTASARTPIYRHSRPILELGELDRPSGLQMSAMHARPAFRRPATIYTHELQRVMQTVPHPSRLTRRVMYTYTVAVGTQSRPSIQYCTIRSCNCIAKIQ